MKTMSISKFKANALRVIDEVARTQESVVITKRGKPLAEVMPYRSQRTTAVAGKLAHTLVFEGDIITPLGSELWEAAR